MSNIDEFLELTREKLERLKKNADESRDKASEWSEKFLELYNKGQNETGLALALTKEESAKIHNRISQVSLLMEMSLSIIGLINVNLKEFEKKYPELRKELSQQIADKLNSLVKKVEDQEQIDKDINKKAKDREDKLGGMFG